jgi:hypothetical protein
VRKKKKIPYFSFLVSFLTTRLFFSNSLCLGGARAVGCRRRRCCLTSARDPPTSCAVVVALLCVPAAAAAGILYPVLFFSFSFDSVLFCAVPFAPHHHRLFVVVTFFPFHRHFLLGFKKKLRNSIRQVASAQTEHISRNLLIRRVGGWNVFHLTKREKKKNF